MIKLAADSKRLALNGVGHLSRGAQKTTTTIALLAEKERERERKREKERGGGGRMGERGKRRR